METQLERTCGWLVLYIVIAAKFPYALRWKNTPGSTMEELNVRMTELPEMARLFD